MPWKDMNRLELVIDVPGRYALYSAIGAGGMATVHLGRLLLVVILFIVVEQKVLASFSDRPAHVFALDRAVEQLGNAVNSLCHSWPPTHQ